MEREIFGLPLYLVISIVWFLPTFLVAFSKKTFGAEKVTWIIAILAVSWFSWMFYFIIAPVVERPKPEETEK